MSWLVGLVGGHGLQWLEQRAVGREGREIIVGDGRPGVLPLSHDSVLCGCLAKTSIDAAIRRAVDASSARLPADEAPHH